MTTFTVDFGSDYATLTSVGFTELDSTGTVTVTRVTSGIVNLGNGAYVYTVTPDASSRVVRWDTGTIPPVYAHEDIAPAGAGGGITVDDIMNDSRALTVGKFLALK